MAVSSLNRTRVLSWTVFSLATSPAVDRLPSVCRAAGIPSNHPFAHSPSSQKSVSSWNPGDRNHHRLKFLWDYIFVFFSGNTLTQLYSVLPLVFLNFRFPFLPISIWKRAPMSMFSLCMTFMVIGSFLVLLVACRSARTFPWLLLPWLVREGSQSTCTRHASPVLPCIRFSLLRYFRTIFPTSRGHESDVLPCQLVKPEFSVLVSGAFCLCGGFDIFLTGIASIVKSLLVVQSESAIPRSDM